MTYPMMPNTNATSYTIHLTSGYDLTADIEVGPLGRAQYWLWRRPRGGWLGNRVSDLRYWMWRVSR